MLPEARSQSPPRASLGLSSLERQPALGWWGRCLHEPCENNSTGFTLPLKYFHAWGICQGSGQGGETGWGLGSTRESRHPTKPQDIRMQQQKCQQ